MFQLSSGESSLLNLGLSILRDADLSSLRPEQASDIHGIVIIDEIDLHLHATQQHEILPNLIKMFPKVQFIVTTHSPLFVLGMQREFGKDGFSLYQLPESIRINPEEFSEFGHAYSTLKKSQAFEQDIRAAMRDANKPLVFVEGAIDKKYIERAFELLDMSDTAQRVSIVDKGGTGNLEKLWQALTKLDTTVLSQPMLVLFDCDAKKSEASTEMIYRRTINFCVANPIQKGIENLLGKNTLERAIHKNPKFIDIHDEHNSTVRGEKKIIPTKWSVNPDEKMNLCTWICENGQPEDFSEFQSILELISELATVEEPSG